MQASQSKISLLSQKLKQSKSRIIPKAVSRTASKTPALDTASDSNRRIFSSRSRSRIRSKKRNASELSRRPRIKAKSAAINTATTTKNVNNSRLRKQELLTKCSSKGHHRLYISPAFSKLQARLRVSSNLGRNYSVVDLATRADQQTIRWAFTRTVLTFTASLLLFTALSLVAFGLLSERGTLLWPGVLTSLALTGVISLLLSFFAYWTKFDFTSLFKGCYLLLLALAVLVAAVLYGADGSQLMKTIFDGTVTVCLLFFLAMTTQMIVGDEGRRWSIPLTRYIRAALTLYAEIMALYFYLPGVRLVK